jgi:hypothetical protein
LCGRDAFCPQPKKHKKTSKCEKKEEERKKKGSVQVWHENIMQLTKYIHDSSLKLSVIVKKIFGLVNDPRLGLDLW